MTMTNPMPRIDPRSAEKYPFVIDDGTDENLVFYVAIPIAAVAFIVILAVMLCMKSENVQVVERRQTIDAEEGIRNGDNWERQISSRRQNPNPVQENIPVTSTSHVISDHPVKLSPFPKTPAFPRSYSNEAFESPDKPGASGSPPRTAMLPNQRHAKVRPVGQVQPMVMPSSENNASLTSTRPLNNENRRNQSRSKSEVQSHTLDRIAKRQQPDRSWSLANSLDASPAFQRLKYGTYDSRSRRSSDMPQRNTPPMLSRGDYDSKRSRYINPVEEEVHLSNYKMLKTDLNYGVEEKFDENFQRQTRASSKYNTLDVTPRAIRRSQRRREDEQQWARENFLTTEKPRSRHKSSTLRPPKTSISSVAGTLGNVDSRSTEDLPKGLHASNLSLNSIVKKRSSRTLNPSPYKLQVKNSIRPNRKIEYRDGFRRKKPSILIGRSLRRKPNRLSSHLELGVTESPSFYLGFETPLPPSMNDIQEKPSQNKKSNQNYANSKEYTGAHAIPAVTSASGKTTRAHVAKTLSTKSDHDYEEIESQTLSDVEITAKETKTG